MATKASHTILVCDDGTGVSRFIIECLSDSDYRVITASNGLEASLLFERCQPDLLVANTVMPVLDGLSMVNYLARSHPSMKAILMTDSLTHARESLCLQLDDAASIYLMEKPLDVLELISTVHLMLHSRPCAKRLISRNQNEGRLN